MADDPPSEPFVRTNPLDENERTIATYLRAQHLTGVDTDDEAAVALEIEQARLLLVGTSAVIFFSVTQMLTLSRPICASPLYCAIPFLLIALVRSWLSLLDGATLRAQRVDRRYKIYDKERAHYIKAQRDGKAADLEVINGEWDRIIKPEIEMRKAHRLKRRISVEFATVGIAFALWSVFGTMEPRVCPTSLHNPPEPRPAGGSMQLIAANDIRLLSNRRPIRL